MVAGDVDNATSPTLETQIARKSRSGTYPLNVGLSSATHLGSSGLRILAEALERAPPGTELALVASPGSPARHVLVLVGLPLATEAVADRFE